MAMNAKHQPIKRTFYGLRTIILGLVALAVTAAATAGDSNLAHQQEAIGSVVSRLDPNVTVNSVFATDVDDLYGAVIDDSNIIYFTGGARHILAGTLISNEGDSLIDMTEQKLQEIGMNQIASLPETQHNESAQLDLRQEELKNMAESARVEQTTLTFKPENPTGRYIEVFTDTGCPHCRNLHREVPQLNELGIEVRYYAYVPRGPSAASFINMSNAFCSDDPNSALGLAMMGRAVPRERETTYCDQIIMRHIQLGRSEGVRGTPTIKLDTGEVIVGSRSASTIAQEMGLQ